MCDRLKSILMVVIPHKSQRYPTVGDWVEPSPGQRMVSVSDVGNDNSNFLIGSHEEIEQHWCKMHGVTQADVDRWDMAFNGEGEPGDDPECPYHEGHVIAMKHERELCADYGLDWEAHETAIEGVYNDGTPALP
jgi:hypothetical protein